MSSSNNIPQKDAELARNIGQWLDDGQVLSTFNNRDVAQLVAWKNSAFKTSRYRKQQAWQQIESIIKTTDSQPGSTFSQFTLSPVRSWAAAAILLIVAFSIIFYIQQPLMPQLIAQSGESIEQITLTDGSEITLRPNSAIYLIEEAPDNHTYKLEGEGYFSVSPDPERLFAVQTDQGIAEVLGTRFNLREWNGQTELFLEEGSVQLLLADRSDSLVLEPGQITSISPAGIITPPESITPEEFTSWRNLEITFSNRTAESIFQELEYHFKIEINAPGQILSERLGGSITLQNREESLQDLGLALGGEFVTHDGKTYQFVSEN